MLRLCGRDDRGAVVRLGRLRIRWQPAGRDAGGPRGGAGHRAAGGDWLRLCGRAVCARRLHVQPLREQLHDVLPRGHLRPGFRAEIYECLRKYAIPWQEHELLSMRPWHGICGRCTDLRCELCRWLLCGSTCSWQVCGMSAWPVFCHAQQHERCQLHFLPCRNSKRRNRCFL